MAGNLISIALCTYNGIEFLAEQMQSLLQQNYENFEIVIIDDASTDGTYQLLERYQKQNPFIRLYQNTENIGFNRNFEKVLSFCKGDFIAIADQDDVWHPNKLSQMVLKIGDSLLLYHDSQLIINGIITTKRLSDNHRFVKGKCEKFLLYDNCISGHACFINKQLLSYMLPFPKGIYYDWWMGYTAACIGKLNFTKEVLVNHRRHNASSTTNDKLTGRQKRINNLRIFSQHKLNSMDTKALINNLLEGYEVLTKNLFSAKLFKHLVKNSDTLFYTRRKTLFKKIKFTITESFR